jgi:hypothetical protein
MPLKADALSDYYVSVQALNKSKKNASRDCASSLRYFLAISICLMLAGCGGDPLPDDPTPTPKPPSSEELETTKTAITYQIDNAELCKKTTDDCDWSTLTFTPTTASSNSLGKRVLILDNGMLPASVTRYQNRVLAQYDFDNEGHLEEVAPELNVPTQLIPIFEIIWAYTDFISAYDLQDLQSKYLEKFSILGMPGHGESIFTYIAETSPGSQFVLIDHQYDEVFNLTPAWCEQITGEVQTKEEALSYLDHQYDRFLEDLTQIVHTHNVSFINASFGYEPDNARSLLEHYCNIDDYGPITDEVVNDVVNVEHAFLRGVSQLNNQSAGLGIRDEVVLVQAGINSPVPLVENDARYPVDCDPNMVQRLRVADYDNFKADVPVAGSQDTGILSDLERNALACTDVYLTLGYGTPHYTVREERERSFKSTLLGIGWAPHVFPPTSSFAAPVALSRLINLEQQQSKILSASELIQLLTVNGTVKIQDPIQHEQFELNRLQP